MSGKDGRALRKQLLLQATQARKSLLALQSDPTPVKLEVPKDASPLSPNLSAHHISRCSPDPVPSPTRKTPPNARPPSKPNTVHLRIKPSNASMAVPLPHANAASLENPVDGTALNGTALNGTAPNGTAAGPRPHVMRAQLKEECAPTQCVAENGGSMRPPGNRTDALSRGAGKPSAVVQLHVKREPKLEGKCGGPDTSPKRKATHVKASHMAEPSHSPPENWTPACVRVMNELMAVREAVPFNTPVDVQRYPTYPDIVDMPIDFGTIRHKLCDKSYEDIEQWVRDVDQVVVSCPPTPVLWSPPTPPYTPL